jgi:hypothetical protein
LIADLRRHGYMRLRAVDVKPPDHWYQRFPDVENLSLDLQQLEACRLAVRDAAIVYNLAADMGGMGFIELNKARCMLSVLINTHLLVAAREVGVERFFFSSSACVYAHDKQTDPDIAGLKEEDAYPALPEDGYGWEKLFSERMCRHFRAEVDTKRHTLARSRGVASGAWTRHARSSGDSSGSRRFRARTLLPRSSSERCANCSPRARPGSRRSTTGPATGTGTVAAGRSGRPTERRLRSRAAGRRSKKTGR